MVIGDGGRTAHICIRPAQTGQHIFIDIVVERDGVVVGDSAVDACLRRVGVGIVVTEHTLERLRLGRSEATVGR